MDCMCEGPSHICDDMSAYDVNLLHFMLSEPL